MLPWRSFEQPPGHASSQLSLPAVLFWIAGANPRATRDSNPCPRSPISLLWGFVAGLPVLIQLINMFRHRRVGGNGVLLASAAEPHVGLVETTAALLMRVGAVAAGS